MPPLIAFAGVLGGLAVVRWAYRTALEVNQELEEARWRAPPRPRDRTKFRPAAGPDHRRLSAGLIHSTATAVLPSRSLAPASGSGMTPENRRASLEAGRLTEPFVSNVTILWPSNFVPS